MSRRRECVRVCDERLKSYRGKQQNRVALLIVVAAVDGSKNETKKKNETDLTVSKSIAYDLLNKKKVNENAYFLIKFNCCFSLVCV